MSRRILVLTLSIMALGAATTALADPPPADETAEVVSKVNEDGRTSYRFKEIGIPGVVHEPHVTFITGRPDVNADGELVLEHSAVPALLSHSTLPRGDG